MENQNSSFSFAKKKLVIAMGIAMVTGVMGGCSGGGGGGGAAAAGAVPDIYTIKATGGDANASDPALEGGYGGNGGELAVSLYGGTGGVAVRTTGTADTSFSSPLPNMSANTGTNPLEVTADTSVEVATLWSLPVVEGGAVGLGATYIGTDGVLRTDSNANSIADYLGDNEVADARFYTDGSELYVAIGDDEVSDMAAAGTPYTLNGNSQSSIYAADGDNTIADAAYTGISVADGASLTLGLNYIGSASFLISNDIENNGTITTEDKDSINRGDLSILAYNYIASGTIDTGGNSALIVNGGRININVAYAFVNSGDLNSSGSVHEEGFGGNAGGITVNAPIVKNSGAINTSGADSTNSYGGSAGDMNMNSIYIENSGTITSNGGNSGGTFNGLAAGGVRLESEWGTNNSGDIIARGGSGAIGGQQGYVWVYTTAIGTTRNSGNITTTSGAGTVSYAGRNKSVHIEASGGDVINSGDITTTGGDGIISTSSGYGQGGSIHLKTWEGDNNTPPGSIVVSGNLDSSGGDISAANGTGYAGNAGPIYIQVDTNDEASDQGITLLGYSSMDVSGGNGLYAGDGTWESVAFYAGSRWDDVSNEYKTGPVSNEVDIIARGGDAIVGDNTLAARGGYGGGVSMRTAGSNALNNTDTKTSNSGDIDTSGGNNYNSTSNSYGRSGYIRMYGFHGVDNSGTIIANGGNDTATDGSTNGYGGYAQNVDFTAARGSVSNSGSISNNGGAGEYRGGYSRGVDMEGPTVTNSGALSSNGGNADVSLAGSLGGNGGSSTLWGTSGLYAATNSGALSYSGGTGESEGAEGNVYVNLICEGNCFSIK